MRRGDWDYRGSKLPTKAEQQRLKLYHQGWSDKMIANKVNRTVAAIAQWRQKKELKPNKDPKEFSRRSLHGMKLKSEENKNGKT